MLNNAKKKILIIEKSSGRGGSAKSISLTRQAVNPEEFDVIIGCYTDDGMTCFSPGGETVLFKHGLCDPFRLLKFIRREKIDLVHFNNIVYDHRFQIAVLALFGIPMINHLRGVHDPLPRSEIYVTKFLKKTVAISRFAADHYIKRGFPSGKMEVIYNGVDFSNLPTLEKKAEERKQSGFTDGDIVLGIAGSIRPEKGFDTVLKAMVKLGENVKLLVIGGEYHASPGYLEILKAKIEESKIADRVVFRGHVENPLEVLGGTDIVLFPTLLEEGFGRGIVEAGALELPIISSRIGATPELVKDGETGYLVTPGDDDELAEKLKILIEDKELRVGIGKENFRYCREKFSIEKNVEQTEEIYRSVLS